MPLLSKVGWGEVIEKRPSSRFTNNVIKELYTNNNQFEKENTAKV